MRFETMGDCDGYAEPYDEVYDELVEEGILNAEDPYDRYRDEWCDALDDAAKKFYDEYVNDKKGYYFDAPERFLTHLIKKLQRISGCDVMANFGRVTAYKAKTRSDEAKLIEFVEGFEEATNPELLEVKKSG